MQELRANPKILQVSEEISHEVWKSAQHLNKGPVKMDHGDVRSAVETAMLLLLLTEIRDELRLANHDKRMAMFPNSMLAKPNQQPGESP